MKRAWIENGFIFMTEDPNLQIPFEYIEVPDDITFEDLCIKDNKIVIKSEEDRKKELIQRVKEKILSKWREELKTKLTEKGYHDLGDLFIYASIGEPEAIELKNWYLQKDKDIFNLIDNLSKMSIDELKQFIWNKLWEYIELIT